MSEVVVSPVVLIDAASRCRHASHMVEASAVAFARGSCLRGPVGTSLALAALDERMFRYLSGLAGLSDSLGAELEVAASLYATLEGV